ncbi:MAG: haloacid dehalogenase [Candidatus Micrarchaeia archaeon]
MAKFKKSIEKIVKLLEEEEREQDELLKLTREIVRGCSVAIKCIHSKELKESERRIEEVKKLVEKMSKFDKFENITIQAYQEYAEAGVLLSIIKRKETPTYEELGVPFKAYLLGLLDCVGELRREMLEELKRGNKRNAGYYFSKMEELYEALLPVRFSNSLIPNFRRKQDVARMQLEQARSELLR